PRVLLLCAAAPAATLAWAATRAGGVLDGEAVSQQVGWVPGLGLAVDLRLDGFGLLMLGLISGAGVAIFAYGRWYFPAGRDIGVFAGVITAFSGSMLGVVLADNLLLLYVFWELTSITSYLLIGTEHEKGSARSAALQAILVTGAGGLAMLAGFVLLGQAAGTYSLSAIVADPPRGGMAGAGVALVLLGAFTKSAQVPFHSWLPGAMAAPTPVSAYLHSATMVKAGVYLVARLAPAFAGAVGFWRPVVLTVGLATMLLGGWRALRQHDLKLLLAFGTVSQLGFMVVLLGAGHPDLTFAGAALVLAHGLFKAVLFMVVGIVDHQAHSRDLRRLHDLGRRMPVVAAVAAVAAASMAGLPLLLGFLSKEAAYEALLHSGGAVVTAGVVAGSVLTFAYGARFLWGAFAAKPEPLTADVVGDVRPPRPGFVVPSAVLAALTVALGLVPAPAGALARGAARSLDPRVEAPKLVLWHGFTTALLLSVVTVAAGVVVFARRAQVERLQARLAWRFSAQGGYEGVLHGLNRVADRTTGVVQNGSLPIYVGVILLTAVVVPGWALVAGSGLPSGLVVADSPLQVLVAGIVVAGAVACALSHRRFAAVLLLGSVGFGVAVLFVIQGAPDLALTQLLVETLALIIFVLVLRHLPERFDPPAWRVGTALRLALAGAVGAFVTFFALVAGAARTAPPPSAELVERALPDGGGRNVVNVILTDFRAFDTMGEITVLTVAALGIATLVRAGRHDADAEEPGA
ncbi:MAG TPA: hydrogen gas-evolving membrane-bound hydrogenase subunit E, partial [Acidimicrobiales bacterium]|nr:hydrogen gas-evolving membrane-bound hydrogenase subunit E [Acidimicrobiales bacterium]